MMIVTETSNNAAAAATDDTTSERHVVAMTTADVTSPSNNNSDVISPCELHLTDRVDRDVSDDVMHGHSSDNNNQLADTAAAASTDDDDDDDDDSGHLMVGERPCVDDFINSSSSLSSSSLPPAASLYHSEQAYHASLDRPMPHRSGLKQHWGAKGEMVYSLLSILGTHNRDDMSRTLLAMSTSSDSCLAMRQSGCLPLLVHLIHDSDEAATGVSDQERAIRARASAALHNVVMAAATSRGRADIASRHEARVLRLLEQLRSYCDQLRPANTDIPFYVPGPLELHPGPSIAALMKLSFDEQHRQAICALGGLQAIAELLHVDSDITGNTDQVYSVTMRRYACMALTNLTFADGANKALLCSMLPALRAVVLQLDSPCEDLCQVAASVLRNLSWHSDLASKRALRNVDAAVTLMRCAMAGCRRETTLKSVLSALWNLSSHSADNKADICSVPAALEFLVNLLSYRSPSKTLSVVENAGGIIRNVSSHVAVRDDHRAILRRAGCLPTLLRHLRSPSLTVVSNACGTLWNLSARCAEDQSTLLQLGAVAMLKNLVHSRHRMISMGSAAALKNLLTAAANLPCVASDKSLLFETPLSRSDSTVASSMSLPVGLHVRRQRALEDDLNRRQLSETCDDMDSPATSPTSTVRSPADVRSTSACFMSDVGTRRRIQSPSPLRLSQRSPILPYQSPSHRSSSHAGIPASHSSDEISAWDRLHTVGVVGGSRRFGDWSSQLSSDNAARRVTSAQMTSTFTGCYDRSLSLTTSPSNLHSPPAISSDFVRNGLGSRRFLKSSASKKPSTEPSTGMAVSFLSERTENIHLDDLELKSSCHFDVSARSGLNLHSQSACVHSVSEGHKSTNDLSHTRPQSHLYYSDESAEDKSLLTCSASNRDVNITSSEPHNDRLDQLMQLQTLTDCALSSDVTSCGNVDNQFSVELTETSANICHLQQPTNSTQLNNDKVLNMNISTLTDEVSDIMDESFPNSMLSTNSDLQSSTDLLNERVSAAITVSSDKIAEECELDLSNTVQANCAQVEEMTFSGVDRDVLCHNSAELVSLLEENANRVLRELELNTAESTSSCEIRLLEDETISLVSGHNDDELNNDDDDDDDDDDYIDAISSRTYDISSASGEAACLSSRHSSSRSPSSGSDSRHSSPPATPMKSATPARPRIVKPGDNVEQRKDKQTAEEGKGIRGRRKALYSVNRPKIPPTTQGTTRPSSAVKPRPVTANMSAGRRPSSADTVSNKPAVVRPVTSKSTSVNNKSSPNASRRATSSSTTTVTARAKSAGQSAAQKKPTTTQSNVVDSKVKRRADTSRARSESTASSKSTVPSSRPSSSNQPTAAASKNDRPTPPIKQATFVKADQSSEDTVNTNDESVMQTDRELCNKSSASLASAAERPAVNKERSRPSSASSVRSNKPAVLSKPSPPVRDATSCKFTAALRVGVRHSSPSSVRGETSNSPVRVSQPSLPANTKSSSSSPAASAPSASRGMKSVSAASPARKPVSGPSQTAASSNVESPRKPSQSVKPDTTSTMLTRTSTYDKLDDAQSECSVGTVCSDVQSTTVNVDSLSENSSEPLVMSLVDSKAVMDSCQLSEVVIRRARQLVEQADQIQTRYVSPPQSIRFSSGMQPLDDVIQRPSERQMNVEPHTTGNELQASAETTESTVTTSPPAAESVDEHAASRTSTDAGSHQSPSVDKLKPSPVRKFGFIGLWRRQRPEQPASASTTVEPQKRQENTSVESPKKPSHASEPRRKTFSWWRRTASSADAGSKTSTINKEGAAGKSGSRVFGRGSALTDVNRPRSPTCRAAVVTPFSYRPSPPSVFADLPQSHQTKTAMLIERRMRRLKMASESTNEQTSNCVKSKPEVASQRKNLLVTTV